MWWFEYALFMVPLFLISTCILTGLPLALSIQNYYRNRGSRTVTCPESHDDAVVEVDNKYAFWMAFRGQEHSRLQSCSRWPEKQDCGQECLAQLEASPENIERLLTRWYEGKSCALCARELSPADWQRSRLAVLNDEQQMFELRELPLEQLQFALEEMKPLCWNCHQEEREQNPVEPRHLTGERYGVTTVEDYS